MLTSAQIGPFFRFCFLQIFYFSDIAEAILDTLKALYFFVDRDCIGRWYWRFTQPQYLSSLIRYRTLCPSDQMPLLLAAQLGVFPAELDRRLVHLLCDCILPYSFGEGANGRASVPAVLILILHHSSDPCEDENAGEQSEKP